jgi:hypothetical protein
LDRGERLVWSYASDVRAEISAFDDLLNILRRIKNALAGEAAYLARCANRLDGVQRTLHDIVTALAVGSPLLLAQSRTIDARRVLGQPVDEDE